MVVKCQRRKFFEMNLCSVQMVFVNIKQALQSKAFVNLRMSKFQGGRTLKPKEKNFMWQTQPVALTDAPVWQGNRDPQKQQSYDSSCVPRIFCGLSFDPARTRIVSFFFKLSYEETEVCIKTFGDRDIKSTCCKSDAPSIFEVFQYGFYIYSLTMRRTPNCPISHFLCDAVKWDNGEYRQLYFHNVLVLIEQ